MKITLSPRAEKQLRKLPKFDSLAIAQKIRNLPDIKVSNIEKLSGFSDIFRIRVGNYRIVYKKSTNSIYIILIGHRRDIYKLVKELLS